MHFGFKEDSLICEPCYYEHILKLYDMGKELRDKKYFTLREDGTFDMKQELAKYKLVRKHREYVKHTIYPELIDWCDRMENVFRN